MLEIIQNIFNQTVEGAQTIANMFSAIVEIYSSFWDFLPAPINDICAKFMFVAIIILGFKIYGLIKGG